jgi:hypothetical protein
VSYYIMNLFLFLLSYSFKHSPIWLCLRNEKYTQLAWLQCMSWKSFVNFSFSTNYSLLKYLTNFFCATFLALCNGENRSWLNQRVFWGGNGPKLPYFKELFFEIAKFRLQVLTCCQNRMEFQKKSTSIYES